jgi:perosamine synthetase
VRKSFLPFARPEIGDEEIAAVTDTLRSGWITTGPMVKRFEQEFAAFVGAPAALALSSCTAALHLALEAVGIQEGDEVIVPTMTFAATAEVVRYFNACPVLVDCQPDTLNIDPDGIERAITSRTRAIIPVHFGGQPCEMDRILEIARRHDLRVVEDAAHALSARYQGKTIGMLGDVTCFSFYATKTITTGEGGMATTGNPELAERMRLMSLHGISTDAWKRYAAEGSWSYEIIRPGYKYNMTDLAAAIGVEQLKKCQRFREARRRIAAQYNEGFIDLPEVRALVCRADVQHAWHLYVIQLELERLRISRNECIVALKKKNIGTSVHFIPLHLHPYYRKTYGYQPSDFPTATAAIERTISLPIYPAMADQDVQDVIEAVTSIVKQYQR